MLRSALIAVAALAAVTSAQNTTVEPTGNTTYFYGDDGSLQIDPTLVSEQLRSDWCLGQRNNCPEVCEGQVSTNDCDTDTLEWTCTCSDSSLQPNITDYEAMMPSYICQEWVSLCTYAHPDDSIGQEDCQSITCGERNASASSTGDDSTTTSSAPTGTSSPSSTTGGSTASPTSDDTASATADAEGSAAAFNVAQAYGSSILVAGLLGIFGLAL